MFAHKNWMEAGIVEKLKKLAERRNLSDLTIGPVLTWNNKQIKEIIDKVDDNIFSLYNVYK